MRTRSAAASSLVVLASVVLLSLDLVGCASATLDYQTALTLMRDEKADPLKITFSAVPRLGESDPKIKQGYDQLIEGHVIDCLPNPTIGTLCQPGAAGSAITSAGSTDLSLIVGQWIPSVITGIVRSGANTATVEARLAFEPSPLYREYQDAFDTLQNSAESRAMLAQQKDGKSVQATFVHSEDGWRVEASH
ncbi:MAG: hypothetical protein M3Y27_01870 [Acidobacteriota bacterium]|nr:hypothetical protein [Acidobacteriota bacterium]